MENLKRPQECDQILFVWRGQVQTERMALNRARAHVKALWHVIGIQARWVEPFFQSVGLAAMAEALPGLQIFPERMKANLAIVSHSDIPVAVPLLIARALADHKQTEIFHD